MLRSPIFILLLFILSCQDKTTHFSESNTKHKTQKNSLAENFSSKADNYYATKKFDSAYFFYTKSKELFVTTKDSDYVAYNLLQMARILQIFGDYNSSEETLTEALPYVKNNNQYQVAIDNLLGISSKEQENYDEAIYYYNKILKTTTDSLIKITPLNNIATLYFEQKKYDKAIKILEPISKSSLIDTLYSKKALITDNLGFAYYKINNTKKGLSLMNKALTIRNKINDSYGCIQSYLHLAQYYQNNDIQKSNINALEAYKNATKHQSINERLKALIILMSNNFKVGKNKFATQFVTLNDSITTVRNNAKNQFAKIKYDSKKSKAETLQFKAQKITAELELQKQKNQTTFYVFGIVFLIILIVLLIYHFKNKSKQQQLQASYTTETRIAKKLHDELANDVFYTMSFAENQNLENPENKEILIENLDKIYLSTRNLSRENNQIDTNENYEFYLKQMITSYENNTIKIIIANKNSIEWLKINAAKKIILYRVLQELMVNMKKHSKANIVLIGFEMTKNDLKIEYSDNGIGIKDGLKAKNGLQNVENRIKTLNGSFTFDTDNEKGFAIKISLPK